MVMGMKVAPPFKLVSRHVIWPGEIPRSTNGVVRPPVRQPAPYVTVHDTGSPGDWADFGDTSMEARAIHAYSQHAKKPWEYNWIGDTEGNVVEYAGLHQAAHSAGENHIAHGYLFLLGVGQKPSEAQILAFRQWRWWMLENGWIAPDHQLLQHNQMPGAATACPSTVIPYWSQVRVLWTPTPPPPSLTYGAAVDYFPLSSDMRRLDTRQLGAQARVDQKISLPVGRSDAVAAVVTLTVVDPLGGGYIEGYPGTSCINWTDSTEVIANTTYLPVVNGNVEFTIRQGRCHVIADLLGVYA